MQDGGLPHIGCRCSRCAAAYQHPEQAAYAACLAIVDKRGVDTAVWLIDATPDIKLQLNLLATELGPHPRRSARIRQPDGLFLTHAHMGHIGGLPQLGPEAMAVEQLPVYATAGLVSLLKATPLWQPAMSRLDFRPLSAGEPLSLGPDLAITPLAVPHRDEWGVGTVAYHMRGPRSSLLYLPDIDAWQQWPEAEATLAAVDISVVDASFYSAAELGGRDPVAHPLVPDTLHRMARIPGQLVLTHFNHTNPVLDINSPERQSVLEAGALIASRGMTFHL
jgi:pyrroloquinoline quinone biosynthesis protein B